MIGVTAWRILSFLNPFIITLRTNYRVVRENQLRDRSDAFHCRLGREQNKLSEISHPSASHRFMLSNGDSQKRSQDLSHSISNINFILTNQCHSHFSVYEWHQDDNIYQISCDLLFPIFPNRHLNGARLCLMCSKVATKSPFARNQFLHSYSSFPTW